MKFKLQRFIFPFIIVFLNFSPALAQSILQKAEIEKYIGILPQISALAQLNDQETQPSTPLLTDEFGRTPISDNLIFLKERPNYNKFTDLIIKAGFLTAEEWANVGDKIMMAYSAYHLKYPSDNSSPTVNEIKSSMQDRSKLVEANQFISNEQKRILLKKIQNSMALLNDPNYINNENISIISPYIERLNSLFKEYQ